MYDDSFDILPVPDRLLFRRVAALTGAAGALAGGGEALVLSWKLPMHLTIVEMFTLGVTAVALNGVFAAGLGALSGLFVQLLLGRMPRWRRYTAGFTLGVVGLALFYAAPAAFDVYRQGRPEIAAGMLAVTVLIGTSMWYNARFWFRRLLVGAAPVLGFRALGTAAGLLLASLASLLHQTRSSQVIAMSGTNLILITVDTLRRDHLGVYGGSVPTPNLDALAKDGLLLMDAVSPLPETAPAHASMLTGLHPLEHKVQSNGLTLAPGFRTVTEQLYAAGYRTGAFLSSFAVDSRVGLDQGFEVYDDDYTPFVPGLAEVRVAAVALRLLVRFGNPADFPFLLERNAPRTIDHALRWARSESKNPVFLWVHLFEPHAPYETHDGSIPPVNHRKILALEPGYPYNATEEENLRALYAGEVSYVDAQIGELLDGLRAAGKLDDARVIVIGDHGEGLGEHGVMFTHVGLYEQVVQIPFLFWSSAPDWERGTRITRPVTTMDVANSLLEASGVPMLPQTHSVPVQLLARGAEVPPESVALTGRPPVATDRGSIYGMRTAEGVKCIVSENNAGEIYDIREDPGETNNIAADQPEAMAACRANVDKLRGHATGAKVDAETAGMLEALGYADPDKPAQPGKE